MIAYHIARERVRTANVESAVANAMKKLSGAYALVIASPRKLIGARDPFGFKPLCIGRKDNAWILASESCALDTLGARFIRDVEPGEIVTINRDGIQSDRSMCLADGAYLNISILPDRTACLTGSVCTIPAFMRAAAWPRTRRSRRIW